MTAVPHARHRAPDEAPLPPVWQGSRRTDLVLLVVAGLAQAVCAGLGSHLMLVGLRRTHSTRQEVLLVVALVLAALLVGALRLGERVVTERLSQDYVHEIRLRLLRRDLTVGPAASLGVAVTRTSNDLTSVRNWVAMGLAPLAVGAPLLVGAVVVLVDLGPGLALGFSLPLLVLAACLALLARPAYERTRRLRTARGRLSGLIADTLLASRSVRGNGGSVREVNRIAKRSRAVAAAAVVRARYAGAQRGASASATMLATSGVVVGGVLEGVSTATLTAALTVVGLLSAPVNDLGRVAEYRQTYRAARRVVGPAIALPPAVTSETGPEPADLDAGEVRVAGALVDDLGLAPLRARPGDRVLLDPGDRQAERRLVDALAGVAPPAPGEVRVGGTDLATTGHGRRRRLVGFAAQGLPFGRASVSFHALYRAPSEPRESAGPLLDEVGLGDRVRALPRGAATELRHGGDPLDLAERARLQLARAVFGHPALLVLDRLDADLGPEGCAAARRLLADYPGVVLATGEAGALFEATVRWPTAHPGGLEGEAS